MLELLGNWFLKALGCEHQKRGGVSAHLVGQHSRKVRVHRGLPCHGVAHLRTDNIEPVHRRPGEGDMQCSVRIECLKSNVEEFVELEGIVC